MGGHRRSVSVQPIEQDLAVTQACHPEHALVVGVEHGKALWQDHVDLGAHHTEQLGRILDVEIL